MTNTPYLQRVLKGIPMNKKINISNRSKGKINITTTVKQLKNCKTSYMGKFI